LGGLLATPRTSNHVTTQLQVEIWAMTPRLILSVMPLAGSVTGLLLA